MSDPAFYDTLKSFDLLFFCETWTTELSDISLPNYTAFAMHRTFKHKSARRASGGVIAYIRNEIAKGVTFLKKGPAELLWIKLDRDAFGFQRDILICLCYALPANSTAQGALEGDIFDQITLDFCYFQDLFPDSSVIVCGDMNGRTGQLLDYVECDHSTYLPLSNDYVEDEFSLYPRTSKDTVVNVQGHRILEMCKMCNLRIINGRFGADGNIGKFTCHTYNGSSLVDYFKCTPDLFQNIKDFHVKDADVYSEHCPIILELNAPQLSRRCGT